MASACQHTESCSEGVRMLVFFSKVLPQEPGPRQPATGRMPWGPASQPSARAARSSLGQPGSPAKDMCQWELGMGRAGLSLGEDIPGQREGLGREVFPRSRRYFIWGKAV